MQTLAPLLTTISFQYMLKSLHIVQCQMSNSVMASIWSASSFDIHDFNFRPSPNPLACDPIKLLQDEVSFKAEELDFGFPKVQNESKGLTAMRLFL